MQEHQPTRTEEFPQPNINQPIEKPNVTPTPDNPPWNSGTAFGMWFVSVLLIAIIPTIGVVIYAVAKGANARNPQEFAQAIQGDPNAILVNLILIIPVHILTISLSWLIVTKFRKYSFREMLGWQWGGFNIFYLIGIVVGFFVLSVVLASIFGEQETELTRILKSSRNAVYVTAFMATFTAPLVEEVVYRGILYPAFQRSFGVIAAIGLVTLLFAGVHFLQYWESPVALFLITSLSLVLTLIRAKSGNLFPCIVLHTIFNGVQSLGLIFEPLISSKTAEQKAQMFFQIFK